MTDTLFPHTPKQLATFAIYLLVVLLVAFDFRRPLSKQNLYLGLMFLPALPLFRIMRWERYYRLGESEWQLVAAFKGLFFATALMAGWSLLLALGRGTTEWRLNLKTRGLALLAVVLLALNLFVTLGRHAEDSGPYTALGAQKWVETGILPYGDPMLKGPESPGGGSAATYGPLLMVAHIPFQAIVGFPGHPPEASPMDPDYERPPDLVTQMTCFVFHLGALAAMFLLVRRLADTAAALAVLCLYMASPYVIGLGDYRWLINGLTFISHIAPPAAVLGALWALPRRPWLSGALLAVGCGLLYFPAFFFPVFLGWCFWNLGRRQALAFTAGFALVGLLTAWLVIHFTPSIGDQGPVSLFFESTLEHQEGTDSREYGASHFSFWGTHPGVASFFQRPLFGESSMFKPTFLLFSLFSLAGFLLARGRSVAGLALLIASIGAALQLWKTHAGGSYVVWYFPFLLIGLFAREPAGEREPGAGPS